MIHYVTINFAGIMNGFSGNVVNWNGDFNLFWKFSLWPLHNQTINCQTNQLMATARKKQKSRIPPQTWEPIPEMSSEAGRALEENNVFVSFNRTEQVVVQKGTILGVTLLQRSYPNSQSMKFLILMKSLEDIWVTVGTKTSHRGLGVTAPGCNLRCTCRVQFPGSTTTDRTPHWPAQWSQNQ